MVNEQSPDPDKSVLQSGEEFDVEGQPVEKNSALKPLFSFISSHKAIVAISGALVLVLVGTLVWWINGPRKDTLYWESLIAQGLDDEYASRQLAVLQGQAFCDKVRIGEAREAFWYQKTAVDFYCPSFSGDVKIVLTEKEKNEKYLSALRKESFAGEFASDAEAIAAGNVHCEELLGGAKPQGSAVQEIAVKSFCPDFLSGYRVLETFTVEGSLTLVDTGRFPSIRNVGLFCEGKGGYSDISGGMRITISNADGEKIGETALDTGVGVLFRCKFPFSVELTEGEEEYLFSFGRRGEFSYTEAELKVPDTISLSIGD